MLTLVLVGSSVTLAGLNWYKHFREDKPLWLLQDAYEGIKDQVDRDAQIKILLENDEETAEEITELTQKETQSNRKSLIMVLAGSTAALQILSGAPIFLVTGLGALYGLGALVLLLAHITLPQRESYLRYTRSALMGYFSFTTIGYFVLQGAQGFLGPLGILTQLVNLALIGLLWDDHRAASSQVDSSGPVSTLEAPA